jgi:hypothetical protein
MSASATARGGRKSVSLWVIELKTLLGDIWSKGDLAIPGEVLCMLDSLIGDRSSWALNMTGCPWILASRAVVLLAEVNSLARC